MVNIFLDCSKSMDFGTPKVGDGHSTGSSHSILALNNMDRLCINLLNNDTVISSNVLGGRGQFDRCAAFG